MLVATGLLEGPAFRILFWGQMAFYSLGFLERLIPAGTALRKLASLANFFTVVHFGALSGLTHWLVGTRDIWSRAKGEQLGRNDIA
jgi:hypothetical protein